jgi:hypothetical protein
MKKTVVIISASIAILLASCGSGSDSDSGGSGEGGLRKVGFSTLPILPSGAIVVG